MFYSSAVENKELGVLLKTWVEITSLAVAGFIFSPGK
jgi:hypothetical protein